MGLSSANALGANAISANALATRDELEAAGAKLTIASVTLEDEDGNKLDQGSLPKDKPFKIAATVHLDGLPEDGGLPIVKVNLYVDGIPVGSKHIPYLPNGWSRTVEFDYDPADHAEVASLDTLEVRAFSEIMGFKRGEEDALSGSVTMTFTDASGGDTPSGSGGCDAGVSVTSLAFLGALALWAGKKGKKRV
jgi:hypothetical protein